MVASELIDGLCDELFRLKDRYAYDPVAVRALEKVRLWAEEQFLEIESLQKPYHF